MTVYLRAFVGKVEFAWWLLEDMVQGDSVPEGAVRLRGSRHSGRLRVGAHRRRRHRANGAQGVRPGAQPGAFVYAPCGTNGGRRRQSVVDGSRRLTASAAVRNEDQHVPRTRANPHRGGAVP